MRGALLAILLLAALGDDPVVYTNEDLPPPRGESRPEATEPSPEIPSYDAVRDRDGHGEGWWRQRACQLDAEVAAAALEAQKLHVVYVKNKNLVDPTVPARSKAATAHLKELEAKRAALPEALRESGGLPGWLSGSVSCLETALPGAPEAEPEVLGPTLTLSWKPVKDAAFYVVELQCVGCCGLIAECDVQSLNIRGTSAQVPFEAGRSGRWRVRALDAAGTPGEWSAWRVFENPR